MPDFPPSPVSPADFLEGYVAAVFAELELPEPLKRLDLAVGVRLEGDGGGEWLYTLRGGDLAVAAGSRQQAGVTVIQTVEHWRGGLWDGRGGVVAERALALLRPDALAALGWRAPPPDAELFERLAALGGLMRTVVRGGPAGDWAAGFKFGPGEIPDQATTTISIHYDDAAALARRELSPLEAFLAGRIDVAGDMLLLMQVQAIALEAAEAAGFGR